MRQPSRFSEVGFESMKMGVFLLLDAQNGLTFTGTARRRFSPLSAGSSVLDALWIVAIILEQPAYALIVPSRPIPPTPPSSLPGRRLRQSQARVANGIAFHCDGYHRRAICSSSIAANVT